MSRNVGAYGKTNVPFSDFMWGNYYRQNITLNNSHSTQSQNPISWTWCSVRPFSPSCFPNELQALQDALPIAMYLATLEQASYLPGFDKGVDSPDDCGNSTSFFAILSNL